MQNQNRSVELNVQYRIDDPVNAARAAAGRMRSPSRAQLVLAARHWRSLTGCTRCSRDVRGLIAEYFSNVVLPRRQERAVRRATPDGSCVPVFERWANAGVRKDWQRSVDQRAYSAAMRAIEREMEAQAEGKAEARKAELIAQYFSDPRWTGTKVA